MEYLSQDDVVNTHQEPENKQMKVKTNLQNSTKIATDSKNVFAYIAR